MKLLRITSDNEKGLFDNQLSADLRLEPYSQIALSNASFTNDFSVLDIKKDNNTITFQTTKDDASKETVVLTNNTYVGTDSDGLRLFQDINAQMNAKLSLTDKEFGGEFKIDKLSGRITLQYRIAPLTWLLPSGLGGGIDIFEDDIRASVVDNDLKNVTYELKDGEDGTTTDANRIVCANNLVKGAGVLRATLQELKTDASQPLFNGFRMVLSETTSALELSPINLSSDDKTYSISLIPDATEASNPFKYIFTCKGLPGGDIIDSNGAILRPQPATQNGAGYATNTNDAVELSIQNGKVVGTIYQTISGTSTPITAFSVAYDMRTLMPIVSIQGDSDHLELYNIQVNRRQDFSVNPALNYTQSFRQNPLYVSSTGPPVQPANRPSDFTLDMSKCGELAKFLGFTSGTGGQTFIYTRPNYTRIATFIGDSNFALSSFQSYVVEFMSFPLESYDGSSYPTRGNGNKLGAGGQFSILKVIPNYNTNVDNRVCNYEASNLTFIDVNNSQPIILRNIKARILDATLIPIETTETSVLTILIKKSNE